MEIESHIVCSDSLIFKVVWLDVVMVEECTGKMWVSDLSTWFFKVLLTLYESSWPVCGLSTGLMDFTWWSEHLRWTMSCLKVKYPNIVYYLTICHQRDAICLEDCPSIISELIPLYYVVVLLQWNSEKLSLDCMMSLSFQKLSSPPDASFFHCFNCRIKAKVNVKMQSISSGTEAAELSPVCFLVNCSSLSWLIVDHQTFPSVSTLPSVCCSLTAAPSSSRANFFGTLWICWGYLTDGDHHLSCNTCYG